MSLIYHSGDFGVSWRCFFLPTSAVHDLRLRIYLASTCHGQGNLYLLYEWRVTEATSYIGVFLSGNGASGVIVRYWTNEPIGRLSA